MYIIVKGAFSSRIKKRFVTPYKSSPELLVNDTTASSKILKYGEEFLNQKDELPVDLCNIVVFPPISILLHSATSFPTA